MLNFQPLEKKYSNYISKISTLGKILKIMSPKHYYKWKECVKTKSKLPYISEISKTLLPFRDFIIMFLADDRIYLSTICYCDLDKPILMQIIIVLSSTFVRLS